MLRKTPIFRAKAYVIWGGPARDVGGAARASKLATLDAFDARRAAPAETCLACAPCEYGQKTVYTKYGQIEMRPAGHNRTPQNKIRTQPKKREAKPAECVQQETSGHNTTQSDITGHRRR